MDLSHLLDPPDGDGVVLPCSKCGENMPPMSRAMAATVHTQGIAVSHEVCPADAHRPPTGRYFEVRVDVVEIADAGDGAPQVTEFFEFRHGVRAEDLDSAMRPLAEGLGEKWTKAEQQARIADSPDPTTT